MWFTNPAINYYVDNVEVAMRFYIEHFGFVDTFRTPEQGKPVHVELTIGSFILGAGIEGSGAVHARTATWSGRISTGRTGRLER